MKNERTNLSISKLYAKKAAVTNSKYFKLNNCFIAFQKNSTNNIYQVNNYNCCKTQKKNFE